MTEEVPDQSLPKGYNFNVPIDEIADSARRDMRDKKNWVRVSPYKDPEKQRQYHAQYRRDNKERLLANWQAWVKAHPKRRRAIALASYHRRKEGRNET